MFPLFDSILYNFVSDNEIVPNEKGTSIYVSVLKEDSLLFWAPLETNKAEMMLNWVRQDIGTEKYQNTYKNAEIRRSNVEVNQFVNATSLSLLSLEKKTWHKRNDKKY